MTIPIDLPWWAFHYAFAMLALIPALALLAGASVIWLRHIPWWIGLGLGLLLAVANYGSAYLGMIAAMDAVRSGSFIALNVGLLAGPVGVVGCAAGFVGGVEHLERADTPKRWDQ